MPGSIRSILRRGFPHPIQLVQLFTLVGGYTIGGMNLEQERDLVERAKYSREAFGELYDAHYNRIYGYVLRRTADAEAARDVTATVFYEALKHIKDYRWRGIPFSHWLYRIANREIVDRYHKRKPEVSYGKDSAELEDHPDSHGSLYSGEIDRGRYEDYIDLQSCISRLPRKYQEVIALRYFEDREIKDIAGILRKPSGTVKSLLHRGVEELRKLMEDQDR